VNIKNAVWRGFVKRAQDAWIVFIAGTSSKQRLGFFAAITSKVFVQQVHHRPQVAALFHIDLKEIAQVVHAGRSQAQVPLLLHRRRLGVALRDDDSAQVGAVFARYISPGFFTFVIAEMNFAVCHAGIHKNAPAIVAHLHVAERSPALRIHAHCGAQIHIHLLRALGPHVVPPTDEVRLPLLERALQRAVLAQVYVVRNFFAVVDARHTA
jgi:hypothetical protein